MLEERLELGRLSSAASCLSLKYFSNVRGRNIGIKKQNRLIEKYRKFTAARLLPNQNHAKSLRGGFAGSVCEDLEGQEEEMRPHGLRIPTCKATQNTSEGQEQANPISMYSWKSLPPLNITSDDNAVIEGKHRRWPRQGTQGQAAGQGHSRQQLAVALSAEGNQPITPSIHPGQRQ